MNHKQELLRSLWVEITCPAVAWGSADVELFGTGSPVSRTVRALELESRSLSQKSCIGFRVLGYRV